MTKNVSSEYTQVVTTFGELQVGDLVLDETGAPVRVKKAYDHHIPERMYELELENGTKIKASGNHLWYIETDEDKISHQDRCIDSAKLLADIPQELIDGLLPLAEMSGAYDEPYEVTLLDMVDLFDYKITDFRNEFSPEAYYLIKRIADSVGHIVEHTETQQDLSTGEMVEGETTLLFDGRRIAQQILSLTGDKKFRKRWPVVVGRVVTTDDIFERYPDADIPAYGGPKKPIFRRGKRRKK